MKTEDVEREVKKRRKALQDAGRLLQTNLSPSGGRPGHPSLVDVWEDWAKRKIGSRMGGSAMFDSFWAGYDAFRRGKTLRDNFEVIGPRAEAWDKGWLTALTRSYERSLVRLAEEDNHDERDSVTGGDIDGAQGDGQEAGPDTKSFGEEG